VHFAEWLKVGAIVGVASCLLAWAGIATLSPYMPTVAQRQQKIAAHQEIRSTVSPTHGDPAKTTDPNSNSNI